MRTSFEVSKNVHIIIHSLAFGGRGEYIIADRCCKEKTKATRHKSHDKTKGNSNYMLAIVALIMVGMFTAGLVCIFFDSTMGYPGEGHGNINWREDNMTMATWNSRSMTKVRFDYCKRMSYDVLAITELWNNAAKFANGTVQWTYGQPKENKEGDLVYPDDRAGGTGILLSDRVTKKSTCLMARHVIGSVGCG